MAYVPIEHGVGDIVYVCDKSSHSVRRMKVTTIMARSQKAKKYAAEGGDWYVSYFCQCVGNSANLSYSSKELHTSPLTAFDALPLPEEA